MPAIIAYSCHIKMQAGTYILQYIKCSSDSDRTLGSRGHHNKTCLKIFTNALRPSHERHSKKFETEDLTAWVIF